MSAEKEHTALGLLAVHVSLRLTGVLITVNVIKLVCLCVAWQQLCPCPVADLFVLAEPNKSLIKQTNHYLLLLITVN